MKAPFSAYLESIEPALRSLVEILGKQYEYVSILSTDSVGFQLTLSQHSKSVTNQNRTTERGSVVRVYRGGRYSEFAFNEFDREKVAEKAAEISVELEKQFSLLELCACETYDTPVLDDEPIELFCEKEAEILPETADTAKLIDELMSVSDLGVKTIPGALDCQAGGSSTHISKLFLSRNRTMRQSYVYTEGMYAAFAPSKNGEMKMVYEGVSGLCGPEILFTIKDKIREAPKIMEDVQGSGKIVPGEYDVITAPDVTGLIAHEAFGHGVEMDMFVKGRALGADYIGQRVGSELVTMHEGALCAESVTGYAFDDEGTLAGDVTEIDHGILRTGICDALAAKRLGVRPTGNGKRENYAHKAYTRMTNTIFDSGSDSLDDMIASIKFGYLLAGSESGMEDPKHWGIQCIIGRGYEIKDGKLTGNVVSPIVMTGYVPDLLGNISMTSGDRCVFGTGACGKGHKEWVKVADGGPYLKTKARLG